MTAPARRAATLTFVAAIALLAGPRPIFAQPDASKAESLIGLARVQRDRGDLAAAAAAFREADRLRRMDGALLVEYFWAAANARAADADALARRVLAADPRQEAVRDQLIGLLIERKDEAEVERVAHAGMKADATAALWPRRLAESLLRQGRPREAATWFATAGERRGGEPSDLAQAAAALEAAVGSTPDSVRAWARVSPEVWATRQSWHASRVRAIAPSLPPAEAGVLLDEYVARYPADREARALAVETWARADREDRALDLLGPLLEGNDRVYWLRREADLAAGLGDTRRTMRALRNIDRSGSATVAERWRLVSLLLDVGDEEAAGAILARMDARADRCGEARLHALARLGDARGLLEAVQKRRPGCANQAEWLDRAVGQAVAAGMHREALEVLEPEATRPGASAARRLRLGQLLLWTGRPQEAVAALEPIVAAAAPPPEALDALTDAYRAVGRPADAWRIGRRLAESAGASRRLDLVEIAIEADLPEDALQLLDGGLDPRRNNGAPIGADLVARAEMLAGRALATASNPAAALRRLAPTMRQDSPGPALVAFLESTAAMRGPAAALAVAGEWHLGLRPEGDLLARLALWSHLVGDPAAATEIAARLAERSPNRARVLSAELALAGHRAAEARTLLSPILERDPDDPVALDLLATAAASEGRFDEALQTLARLRARSPGSISLAVREAEWRTHTDPGPGATAALETLAATHPTQVDARLALARVHLGAGRPVDALRALGPDVPAWRALPEDGVRLAVKALRARGTPADALAVLRGSAAESDDLRLATAELTALVEGSAAASAAFERLTAGPRATPAVFAAWARATADPDRRVAVLRRGRARFPDDIDLADAFSVAAWAVGRADEALAASRVVLAADPDRVRPWFVATQSLAAREDRTELVSLLDQFANRFMIKPDVVSDLVNLASGLVRDASDPLASRALEWTERLLAGDRTLLSVAMARARLLAGLDRWPEAIALADQAIAGSPGHAEPLRLRAELLSYSGAFDAALEAYDTYLAIAPDDVEARRQQARVAGWGQQYRHSLCLYDDVASRAPAVVAIAAEREAKAAFYRGAWRDAVPSYLRWLAIEPEEREARFELAQCLEGAGDLAGANREYGELAAKLPLHRQAIEARERLVRRSAWQVGPVADGGSSDGYGGQRLLDRARAGARLHRSPGLDTPWGFGLEAAWRRASAPGLNASGYDVGVSIDRRLTQNTTLSGAIGVESNDTRQPNPLGVGRAAADWRASDRWRVEAGVVRRSFLENAGTLGDRLTLTGPELLISTTRPAWSLALRGSGMRVSDGNHRYDARLDARARLLGGRNELAVLGASEYLGFARLDPRYFSPGGFWRVDVGGEWRHHLRLPRFATDRQQAFSLAYLFGTDNRDETYHTFRVDIAIELARGLSIGGRAVAIRSDVYRDTTAGLFLGLMPGRRRE